MHHQDFALPLSVFSEAKIRALGGVLMQLHQNTIRPIAYIAQTMSPADVRYSTTEQELLAYFLMRALLMSNTCGITGCGLHVECILTC